jgi:hypothetical protein
LTLLGFPAGCPNLFFSRIFLAFSEEDISPDVFGVLLDTLLLGLQYGTPLPSPFVLPQGLPVLTSIHFSLNQRLSDAPLAVLRTAIIFSLIYFPSWLPQLFYILQ